MREQFRSWQITRLEVVAFVVGLVILAFELAAARIVAPYMGDTIYTWTSIIGVILAALALGYARGGIWADVRKKDSDIIWLLLGAAVLISMVNLLKDSVLGWLAGQDWPLQFQAFGASLFLFAAPTFLLGATSPYLARLSIKSVATSGRHLSRVDAASTLGSLVGTFLTGYVLFGLIGSRNLLTILALILVLASFLLNYTKLLALRLSLIGAIALLGFLAPKPSISGFIDEIDTAYSRVIVRDMDYGGRQARVLQTDANALQSGIYTDGSPQPVFAYIRAFTYASDLKPQGSNYLVIGGGAFTFPEYLARKEAQAVVDTIEIDGKLPEISQDYFNFDRPQNLKIVEADGRQFLNHNRQAYDMIFLDAFSSSVPPFQLLSREAVANMHGSLSDKGIVVANIISATEGKRGGLIRAAYSTFRSEFAHVTVYRAQPAALPTDKQNLLLIASQADFTPLISQLAQPYTEFGAMIDNEVALNYEPGLVMTDDYAPVEQLALW